MKRSDLARLGDNPRSLAELYPKLPRSAQKEVLDRVARVAATAIVSEASVRANTSVALSADKAHASLQGSGVTPQTFSSAFSTNRQVQRDLESAIRREVREMGASRMQGNGKGGGFGGFLEDVAEGFTLGVYKAKK